MRHLAGIASIVSVVAACGGSVASGSDGASSGGSSGTSSGSTSGDGCSKVVVKGTRACVPGTAAPDQPIVVQVDDPDGCLGCFTAVEECKVAVVGADITLTLAATQCTPAGGGACPSACGVPKASCSLPPLPPGTYRVEVAGEGARTGLRPRELVVATGASATSCVLASGPTGGVEGDALPTSCSKDSDCRAATFGDICQPCKCPNAAIANASSDTYEALARAAASQCASRNEGLVCGACAPVTPRCEIEGNELTGTCKLDAR